MGVCVTVDNGIDDNCKNPESDQRDAEHSVYYDGDEVKLKYCKYITAQYLYV